MKAYKKTIILTFILTLLPTLAGLLLWNQLPDKIPSHWGFSGQIDGWSSKPKAVFMMPCIMALGQLVLVFCTFADPKAKNIHKKPLTVSMWLLPIVSIIMNGASYMIALGKKINMTSVMLLIIGLIFILLGNYLPKLQQNYTVGIKVAWALEDADNWERTHRFGGKLLLLGGVVLILLSLLTGSILDDSVSLVITIVIAAACSLVPVIYSYIIYKKKNY